MERFWELFFAFIWVWIPILAILLAGFQEWLKFKSKQRELGTSTHELEDTVRVLEEEREVLVRRVENLEAIVTSQAWDVLYDGEAIAQPAPERRLPLDEAAPGAPSDAEKTARLARRLSA